MIPRVLMEDHLKYTCAQRRARCESCATEFTGLALEKHIGSCGYEPLYCENKCGMKIQRRHLSQHKLGECAKRLVACRYCSKEFVFDTLGSHHAKCGRFPIACPHRCETAVLPREELEIHLKNHCTTHLLPCNFKDAGCRFKVYFQKQLTPERIQVTINYSILPPNTAFYYKFTAFYSRIQQITAFYRNLWHFYHNIVKYFTLQ